MNIIIIKYNSKVINYFVYNKRYRMYILRCKLINVEHFCEALTKNSATDIYLQATTFVLKILSNYWISLLVVVVACTWIVCIKSSVFVERNRFNVTWQRNILNVTCYVIQAAVVNYMETRILDIRLQNT